MGLTDRLEKRRHDEHAARGEVDETCRLCPKDRRAAWLKRDQAKDLTVVR